MCKCGLPRGALVILLFVLLVHFAPIYYGITPTLRASASQSHDAMFATVGMGISYFSILYIHVYLHDCINITMHTCHISNTRYCHQCAALATV